MPPRNVASHRSLWWARSEPLSLATTACFTCPPRLAALLVLTMTEFEAKAEMDPAADPEVEVRQL